MPDAIYRDRYASDAELYASIHPEEAALVSHLAEELAGLPELARDAPVFVPLGVGCHVDHQVVFEAGRILAGMGREVWAYEDSPYCIHTPAGVSARLDAVASALGPPVQVDITETLEARLDAIACYATQVPVLYRFTSDWRGAVTQHATLAGDGRPVERFWPVMAPAR